MPAESSLSVLGIVILLFVIVAVNNWPLRGRNGQSNRNGGHYHVRCPHCHDHCIYCGQRVT